MAATIANSAATPDGNGHSIPIVPRFETTINPRKRARLDSVADRLLAAEPALSAGDVFGDLVESDLSTKPHLLIGDQSEIPLLGSAEETYFGYRIALLAGDGDLVVLAQERSRAFERYLAGLLGIRALDIIEVGAAFRRRRAPLPLRCRESPHVLGHLVDVTKNANGLCLIPHLTTGHVWRLGQAVAEAAGEAVTICGPPPRLSRRVNDKLWFAARVREVLGQTSLPPSFSAYGPAALAAEVRHLAERYARVVVKVPDSAGSAGNLPLESASLKDLSLTHIRERLVRLLAALGWRDRYPLMIEVWDTDVLSTPSVQMWIPKPASGDPVIEGIFEQTVAGAEGNFVGAVRAKLPDAWQERLVNEAATLAYLFQRMGYFGRCSLDAVIVDGDGAGVHWIECNGRWGGVSLPMTLLNRIVPAANATEVVIVQREAPGVRPMEFAQVLERLDDRIYRPGQSTSGVVLLTPTGFERGENMHFMTVAGTYNEAERLALESIRRLMGRDVPEARLNV